MADIGLSIRQRSVVELLDAEDETSIRNYKRLKMCLVIQQWMSAPSDFQLFRPLKEDHRGIHFEDEESMKPFERQWLRKHNRGFYRTGIYALEYKTVEKD
ncbi:hypothetical protein C0J52_09729 [Blattella germanica]|nr:hypothetical protein C0J52_09729 [Blattella germanica]